MFSKITNAALVLMATLGLGVTTSAHASKLLRPNLATELAQCHKAVGPEAPVAASNYAGGLSTSASSLTPASLRGVTTVSPKVAHCLIDAMDEDVKVLQVISEENGIRDAHVLPLGMTRALTAEEQAKVDSYLDIITDGKSTPILVYCHHTSCFLSYNAALRLRDAGYTNVLWMREGLKGWRDAGLPIGPVRQHGNRVQPDMTIRPADEAPRQPYPEPPHRYENARYAGLKAVAGFNRGQICLAVTQHMKGGNTGSFAGLDNRFEGMLYKAAGVDPTLDHVGIVRKKMQAFWKQHDDLLECSGLPAGISGNIGLIKAGVAQSNQDFLYLVTDVWRLPLDKVDYGDGMTVLDYVAAQYNRNADNTLGQRYRNQFIQLRSAGAHLRSELEDSGAWKKPEVLQQEFIALYKATSHEGDVNGSWYLFDTYYKGHYVPVDRGEAMRWLDTLKRQAVEQNLGSTMTSIGQLYSNGAKYVKATLPVDEEEAVRWFRRAGEAGDPSGLTWTGRAYINGRGVPRDVREGIGWLKRAFEVKPDDMVALDIGIAYDMLGDTGTAAKWLRGVQGGEEVYKDMNVMAWFRSHNLQYCGETMPRLVNRFCN